MDKLFTTAAVAIFAIITVMHALRLLLGWDIIIAGTDIPMWVSADRCGISSRALARNYVGPADEGCLKNGHVNFLDHRRHQAHAMPKPLELARPMMRGGAGLDTNEARRQLLKERQDGAPLQLTADENVAFRVDAVDLKYRLGDVETDGC